MAERLILASASARRRELMASAGYRFEVEPADIEEQLPAESEDPSSVAMRLAEAKARHVASRTAEAGRWVVGADTIVVLGRRLIGKPRDAADAEAILSCLSGSRHAVITGVALVESGSGRSLVRSATTWIQMRRIPAEEIRRYVAGGSALGKAGAYAIQEGGDRYVERVEGSVTNVVGLPMELLGEMLAEVGVRALAS
jgi:septum formation protein